MKKSEVQCPDCAAGYRCIELTSKRGEAGAYHCQVCDRLLEAFEGTTEVAYRLTTTPERIFERQSAFGGVFPPVQPPVIVGYLHSMSGLVAIFGSPIALTLIDRSLAGSERQALLSHRLRWATPVAWSGLGLFLASLTVTSLTGPMETPLPPWVSLANRFLIVTYCFWFTVAAWREARATPGR
jgi:hypothetical protein